MLCSKGGVSARNCGLELESSMFVSNTAKQQAGGLDTILYCGVIFFLPVRKLFLFYLGLWMPELYYNVGVTINDTAEEAV